ncbi:MAG: F0F1 ATP synthase subunit A [Epulopiscium sp.]|nr:F0F1 ATP synthase subunit A [Candidatus Epulonipiscium sp.]
MDFHNHNLWAIHIGEHEFWITNTIMNTWIIMGVLILLALAVRFSLKRFESTPKGFQNAVEALVEIFRNFTISTMGEKNKRFSAYFGSIFLFIMLSNLSGLVGLRPPTADLATTLSLALLTFVMIHYYGIKTKGIKAYLKGYFEPFAFLFPINLMGELATPVSLSFRLFGNLLGGTIIMTLYYSIPFWPMKLGIPAALHVYFDMFSGILQTFIFVMLSMTFVAGALEE